MTGTPRSSRPAAHLASRSGHARRSAARSTFGPGHLYPAAACLPLLLIVAMLGAAVGGARSAGAADGPGTMVIAQGMATLPVDAAGEIAWRLVGDVASPTGAAEPRERALGFVVPLGDTVLVGDEDGTQLTLGPNEAGFVQEGAEQRHSSPGEMSVPYLRIGLVDPQEADFAAEGELILAGEPFAAPKSAVDVELHMGEMGEDGAAKLPDSDHPVLMYVAEGSLMYSSAEPAVEAGEAIVFDDGDVIVAGAARFYVATVTVPAPGGPDVGDVVVITDDDGVDIVVEGGDDPVVIEAGSTVDITFLYKFCEDPPLPATIQELSQACDAAPAAGVVAVDTGDEVVTAEMEIPREGDMVVARVEGLPNGGTVSVSHAFDGMGGFELAAFFCRSAVMPSGADVEIDPAALKLPNGGDFVCTGFFDTAA